MKFEFDGFEYINLEDINLLENGCMSNYIDSALNLMEPVMEKFNKVEYQDMERAARNLDTIIIDAFSDADERFSNLCTLFDSLKIELVFSARKKDLTIDGTCQGKFSGVSLSLRCIKEHSVTTSIAQDGFEFEGEPSDRSEFAGNPYKKEESSGSTGESEKTNEKIETKDPGGQGLSKNEKAE